MFGIQLVHLPPLPRSPATLLPDIQHIAGKQPEIVPFNQKQTRSYMVGPTDSERTYKPHSLFGLGRREVALKLYPEVQGDSASQLGRDCQKNKYTLYSHVYYIYTHAYITLCYVTLRCVTLRIYTYVSKSSMCTFIIYVKLKYVEIYIYMSKICIWYMYIHTRKCRYYIYQKKEKHNPHRKLRRAKPYVTNKIQGSIRWSSNKVTLWAAELCNMPSHSHVISRGSWLYISRKSSTYSMSYKQCDTRLLGFST